MVKLRWYRGKQSKRSNENIFFFMYKEKKWTVNIQSNPVFSPKEKSCHTFLNAHGISVIYKSTCSSITITKTTTNDLLSFIITTIVLIIQSKDQLKGDERNGHLFINRRYLTSSLMSIDIRLHSGEGTEAWPPLTALNSSLASLVNDDSD